MTVASLLPLLLLVAAADGDHAAREDRDRIQGTWTVVRCLVGAYEVPSPDGPHFLSFRGDTMWITRNGQPAARGSTIRLDPSKTPRAIDINAEGFEFRGIYEFDGERLRICYHSEERPTQFDAQGQPGRPNNVLYELERKD